MALNRRLFLNRLSGLAGLAGLPALASRQLSESLESSLQLYTHYSAQECASEEAFWRIIQQSYSVSSSIINLNNGGVSPQPRIVQEAVEHYNRLSNEAPSYYMWRILDQGREPLRRKLARVAGCGPEEIAINRNASEALETVIFGLKLQAGDEVVLTKQDYPNMINAWKQRAHRDGIVLKWLDIDFPNENKAELIQSFSRAFTGNTKVVHITHMINWNGQVLPVKEIAAEARARGIQVLVDAAHTFAQLDYTIPGLQCDYFGTSLHKWMCAPIGSGMLYVKKERIKDLYPLFGASDPESADIRKFESLGTRSFAIEQAIGKAIDFHLMIGAERKQKRLHYLKNYWMERVKDVPGVKLHTSFKPEFSGAIGLVSIDGQKPVDTMNFLWKEYKIHTTAIVWENIKGVRVTPNVYTLTEDLDVLVEAIRHCAKEEK